MKRTILTLAGAVFLLAGIAQAQTIAYYNHLLTNTWTIHNGLTASGTLNATNLLLATTLPMLNFTNPPTGYARTLTLRNTDGDGVQFLVRLALTNGVNTISTTNFSLPILLSPDNTNWPNIATLWITWRMNTNGANFYSTNMPSTSLAGARFMKLGGFKFGTPTEGTAASTNNIDSTIWLTNVDVSFRYRE
jgi:hypothetical protein